MNPYLWESSGALVNTAYHTCIRLPDGELRQRLTRAESHLNAIREDKQEEFNPQEQAARSLVIGLLLEAEGRAA